MKTPDENVKEEMRHLSPGFIAWLTDSRDELRELGEMPKLPGSTGVSGVHEFGQAYSVTCILKEIAAARETS